MTAPLVSITSPTATDVLYVNTTFTIKLSASDADGDLKNVKIWDNSGTAGVLLADILAPGPYTFNHTFTTTGTKTLAAKSYDNAGGYSTVASVSFECKDGFNERVLNPDGTVNSIEYSKVAQTADYDYKFGPKYIYFHPTAESFPTLTSNVNTSVTPPEWRFHNRTTIPKEGEASYGAYGPWFAHSGNLVHRPKNTDGTDNYAANSIKRAAAFSDYHYAQGADPTYWRAFHFGPFWATGQADNFPRDPDPAMTDAEVVAASAGAAPYYVAGLERARVKWAIGAAVAFTNGVITVTGTGNDRIYHPYVKMPSNKVPTAIAVAPNNEFIFVTVWDTKTLKGELCTIAVRGREFESDGVTDKFQMYKYWGLPNNMNGTGLTLKILGYTALGISTPNALSVCFNASRWDTNRMYFYRLAASGEKRYTGDLSSQAERDMWSGVTVLDTTLYSPEYHQVANYGYVAVSSRTENKVVLVDIAPLLQFYRRMHLYSQADYDLTQNDTNWPYTFAYNATQKPVVSQTLNITKPTALFSGFPKSKGASSWYQIDDSFRNKLFIATMGGDMLVYNMSSYLAGGANAASLITTIPNLAKNITHISAGRQPYRVDEMVCTSRGDRKAIFMRGDNHTVLKTLRDNRIKDPVTSARSRGHGPSLVHVCDVDGKAAHTYMCDPVNCWGFYPFGTTLAGGSFEYCLSKQPGGPVLYYSVAEVT